MIEAFIAGLVTAGICYYVFVERPKEEAEMREKYPNLYRDSNGKHLDEQ